MLLTSQQVNGTPTNMLPKHVAIIMDGNGRWAKQFGKMRISGHKAGAKAVKKAVTFAVRHQLDALTLYAFSSENWRRPAQEVSALMELFFVALDKEVKNLQKYNIQLRMIGDLSRFSHKLQKKIHLSQEATQHNTGLVLNIAVNYGGRWDIVQAAKKMAEHVQQKMLSLEDINEASLAQYICLNDLTPVDLVIRTGGEHRISNFLLWQIAYAEFYFTDVLWPDFDEQIFQAAVNDYAQRERRFGGVE